MSAFVQILIVVLAVAGAASYLGWQAWLALAGKKSRLGSCCDKGCGAQAPRTDTSTGRIAFFPIEMLGKKK